MARAKGSPVLPAPAPRLRVGVSACLLGQEVRHDGGHRRNAFLTDELGRWVDWVPVCPEVELGLGVPRETIRLEGNVARPRLVGSRSARDLTDSMLRLARTRVAQLVRLDLDGYVLKQGSPSCGIERVPVHPRTGAPRRRGRGLFARVLIDALPLLPVEEEGRLEDPGLRESFVERLLAHGRWKAARTAGLTRGRLVAFHTAHELLLLAHDPAACRRLGALVANARARPLRAVVADYGAAFMRALGTRATRPRHAHVLQHMLGHVSEGLTRDERRELLATIAGYRRGRVPLLVPLTLMRHHVRRQDVGYLLGQVYLDPHPRELLLRGAGR